MQYILLLMVAAQSTSLPFPGDPPSENFKCHRLISSWETIGECSSSNEFCEMVQYWTGVKNGSTYVSVNSTIQVGKGSPKIVRLGDFNTTQYFSLDSGEAKKVEVSYLNQQPWHYFIRKNHNQSVIVKQLKVFCGNLTFYTNVLNERTDCNNRRREYVCEEIEVKWTVNKKCYEPICQTTLDTSASIADRPVDKHTPNVALVVNGTVHNLKNFKAEVRGPPRNDDETKFVYKYIIQTDLESTPIDYIAYNNASSYYIETITARCDFVVWHTTITREVPIV